MNTKTVTRHLSKAEIHEITTTGETSIPAIPTPITIKKVDTLTLKNHRQFHSHEIKTAVVYATAVRDGIIYEGLIDLSIPQ